MAWYFPNVDCLMEISHGLLEECFILISPIVDTRTSCGLAGLPNICPFTPGAEWYRAGGCVCQGIPAAGLGPH